MKNLRIYLDTSIIGGCFDEEFREWSNKMIKEFKIGLYIPVISDLTIDEVRKAPLFVQNVLSELIDFGCEMIQESEESIELAQKYLKEEILSNNFDNDARHIAVATINNVDIIISWNFKHIVHFEKIRQFNSINIREGYKPIEIYSPREVVKYEF